MSYNNPVATTTSYGVVIKDSPTYIYDVGYFYSTQTQTNLLAVNKVTLSNTTLTRGITLVNNSQLAVSKASTYQLSVMMQFSKTSGGSAATINFWLQKNAINVADSTTDMTISNNNSNAVASWNYTLLMNPGDYLEMVWSSTSPQAILPALPAIGDVPATPSVRMTLLEV